MEKVVIIPDSFKGTLSSKQICEVVAQEIRSQFPNCKVISIPIADGGEGTVDCFLAALHGKRISARVKGPLFDDLTADFGVIEEKSTSTAIIEMASCAGLPLVEHHKEPLDSTTYGVGELILSAAQHPVDTIIVGLGGSCTTDGGCGAASAVGVKFYNHDGETFIPTGRSLKAIAHIDVSKVNPLLNQKEIIAICDIDNPMFGPKGAAHVFGPQKGADPATVQLLDEGLQHLAKIIERDLGLQVANIPGSGAAGALGAGMVAFFGATLQSGIDTILNTVHFSEVIQDADYVFTGEGKLDHQSLQGKVVIGVAKQVQKKKIPVIALVGGTEISGDIAYRNGITAIFPINRLPEDFSIAKHKSLDNLKETAQDIVRLIATAEQIRLR